MSAISSLFRKLSDFAPLLGLVFGLLLTAGTTRAGEVVMRSGYRFEFEGKAIPVQALTIEQIRGAAQGPIVGHPFTMFEDPARRTYLPQALVSEVQLGDLPVDEFEVRIPPGPKSTAFGSIGGFSTPPTPFSEFGRRIVTLNTPNGNLEIIQAISKLKPDFVTLTALKQNWEYSISSREIPADVLRATISNATNFNNDNHEDRLAVVRYFLDAGMLSRAQAELDGIENDFPDLEAKVRELRLMIRQLEAAEYLKEFRARLNAGQFDLVARLAPRFPRNDISEATLAAVDQMMNEHKAAHEKMDQVRAGLSRLQAEVKDTEQLERFQDMRWVVDRRLSRNTLERMSPFLQTLDDPTLSAEQKLSLAYSGWVVGPALADTDPLRAIALWDARDRVRDYLQSANSLRQQDILDSLLRLEGIGPETMAAIVRQLGPVFETPAYREGESLTLETMRIGMSVPYEILLPAEYSPDRSYPVIMALHMAGMSPKAELDWWGGTTISGPAHRNGYIVIAPSLQGEKTGASDLHERVLEVLRDARRRFNVDSDRVFLTGHGSGADLALDLGMGHPSHFAGLVSIGGRLNEYAHHYWENCEELPCYYVMGELDGDLFAANSSDITRQVKNSYDVVLVQYKQRGNEDYREELPRILDWMGQHRRGDQPSELERVTMRPGDNRFDWIEFSGLPANIIEPRLSRTGRVIPASPLPIEGTVTPGNNIYLKAGVSQLTVWLSPEIVRYDERVKVSWKGRTMFNDFPEMSIPTMLEQVYTTGDRSRLYWTRIDL